MSTDADVGEAVIEFVQRDQQFAGVPKLRGGVGPVRQSGLAMGRPQEVAHVMGSESLDKAPARRHTFPVAPEFTNWRSEQEA